MHTFLQAPQRVHFAKSIFKGTVAPNKFVLNLFRGDFPDGVPVNIIDYTKEEKRFEIYYSDINYWSATKLIPTIKRFPEETIVIVDEDKEYQPTEKTERAQCKSYILQNGKRATVIRAYVEEVDRLSTDHRGIEHNV